MIKPITHMPKGYECPFCRVISGLDVPNNGTKQEDVIFKNDYVTAFIASKSWPNNKGHVLIVPNQHVENIYELPKEYAGEIHQAAQIVAFAMKDTYRCDGITTRQHNEPAGSQDVWHYHLHVYPRYKRDFFYLTRGLQTKPEKRAIYAEKLKKWIEAHL
ncbi:HIT family protein [Oceanobacillus alkalisoli]|uniref:HIT family protein n=1 Tax=Oceanobacillus alkalisoli TaxID=2925113 RepID=UPI001F11E89C|nr:HIT family protein [Oceanobacillus alkalisoli]MCF3943681.1 HIT family protein [Oceanobacillus alkalisoli]